MENRRKDDTTHAVILEKLGTIEKQTTKTNGHVAKAFVEIGKLKVWRGYITGGLTIITILVLPILLFSIKGYIDRKDTVQTMTQQEAQKAVRSELQSLGIEIDYGEE